MVVGREDEAQRRDRRVERSSADWGCRRILFLLLVDDVVDDVQCVVEMVVV
jgi:hypothetical protein